MARPTLPAHVASGELITSAWGNQVVDALTWLYGARQTSVQALTPQSAIPGIVIIGNSGFALPEANRRYRVYVSVQTFKGAAAGDVEVRCNVGGTLLDRAQDTVVSPGQASFHLFGSYLTTAVGQSGTVSIQPFAGTVDVVGGTIWVQDIGGG